MRRLLIFLILFLNAGSLVFAQYDRDVFFLRGRTSLADGKYAQAIENFNVLARLDTTDYWNFFYRGIAKYNLGDVRGAEKDFDRSVRLNPVFTNGYHYRAISYSRLGRYDDAFKDFDRAIELRPGFMGIYFSRGVAYFLSQQFDRAIDDFDKYIKKNPRDPAAYLNRGASELFLGDTLKALKDYDKAIKLDSYDAEGYIRRGRIYSLQNRSDDAIRDLNKAIDIDSTNTLAYFNRALLYYDKKDYNAAMTDLNRVLADEPGNALTLYNRSLIYAQVGEFDRALEDMDRVININPKNVLAYFNRASYFIQMSRWRDALADYDKAIELYPDFAKAYMNRSYVKNMLGMNASSKKDYETARQKIREYESANAAAEGSFADTTKKYSSLLALDADFAKKDFDNELLQHRDIDIRLRPLYKFSMVSSTDDTGYALSNRYENNLIKRFRNTTPVPMVISNSDTLSYLTYSGRIENALYGDSSSSAGQTTVSPSRVSFIKAMNDVQRKLYSTALEEYDDAVEKASSEGAKDRYSEFYKAFYLMNRGALRAEMIDFIATIQNNVQTLTMDDQGTTRARVSDRVDQSYDYSEAIEDMQEALTIAPDIPYIHFNLGNLYCLSSQLLLSIDSYGKAIEAYPAMGDAYYNRGLVLIYLKDKEKGCIDLSRAGELGVSDAYSVIARYCENEEQ